jgi:hypothetical protein
MIEVEHGVHVLELRVIHEAGCTFPAAWCLVCRHAWSPSVLDRSGPIGRPTWRVTDDAGHVESLL